MSEMNPDVAASKQIDLRRHFPIAFRLIFQRSFHWFIAFAILLILLSGVDRVVAGDEAEFSTRVFVSLATAMIVTAAFFLIMKLLYEILYFAMFDYRIENQQLLVSKGVIWRSRATFPLVKLTDLYLERTPIEIIFFLSTLQITTAAAQNGEHFGGIEGLPFHVARALQTFISELAGTIQPNVQETETKEILKQTVPKPEPQAGTPKQSGEGGPGRSTPTSIETAREEPHQQDEKLDEVIDALGKADETIQRMKEEIQELKNS